MLLDCTADRRPKSTNSTNYSGTLFERQNYFYVQNFSTLAIYPRYALQHTILKINHITWDIIYLNYFHQFLQQLLHSNFNIGSYKRYLKATEVPKTDGSRGTGLKV